ncbi:glutamate racemase [bacterium]|nr:glutamate racemase [bacterium]
MKNKPIAVFDSGVGGLTVYEKLKSILPNENYIYFGDLKNSPYGQKSKEQLLDITSYIFNFFKKEDVKAVVMACNTTSANVYDEYKNSFDYKIYPIIQNSAKVIADMQVEKLGVFATSATINSGAYKREINAHNKNIKIFEMSCPGWVQIVENRLQEDKSSVDLIKENLDKMLENKPDKIILGCTHYPFLLDVLAQFAPREMFIDPAEYFANYIKSDLSKNGLINEDGCGREEFYVSANPEEFRHAAKMFYELKETPKLLSF